MHFRRFLMLFGSYHTFSGGARLDRSERHRLLLLLHPPKPKPKPHKAT